MQEVNKEVISQLRERLQPRGTAPLVRLELKGAAFFQHDFVKECVSTLSTRLALARAGLDEPLNPLETLAVHVLLDSAHIKLGESP
jgi:hypothetical protein